MILPFDNEGMYTTEQLQNAAQRVANVYAEIANREMGCNIPIPVPMTFDLCKINPSWSGAAHSSMLIDLNMILFEDDVADMLNDTIPHEIAHLVQYDKFDHRGADTQNHGAEWQEIMKRLGKAKPVKRGTLDLTRAKAWYKEYKKSQRKNKKAEA